MGPGEGVPAWSPPRGLKREVLEKDPPEMPARGGGLYLPTPGLLFPFISKQSPVFRGACPNVADECDSVESCVPYTPGPGVARRARSPFARSPLDSPPLAIRFVSAFGKLSFESQPNSESRPPGESLSSFPRTLRVLPPLRGKAFEEDVLSLSDPRNGGGDGVGGDPTLLPRCLPFLSSARSTLLIRGLLADEERSS